MKSFKLLRALIGLCLTAPLLVPASAPAQQLSSKPIRLMVGYSPGGGMDSLARLYAAKLPELLGTPVVVETDLAPPRYLPLRR